MDVQGGPQEVEPPLWKVEHFGASSRKCLTSYAEAGLGKCHLPALSPPERAPFDSLTPSGMILATGKTLKLPPLCLVLVGPAEHARPP